MISVRHTHSYAMCFIFFLFATDFLANQVRSRSRRTLVMKLAVSTGCGNCYLTLRLRSAKITIEYRSKFRAGAHDTLPLLD